VTSTTDAAGHPDLMELSDLAEGLLPPTRTADVRQHLGGCPLCANVYDSLEEIRSTLGTLSGPPRMPADIAGRIDAALAAEALLSATAPGGDHAKAPASVDASRPERDEDDGAHVSRETSPAGDRPSGHSRATTGPGRTDRKRRARRRTVALGTVFTAAALGLGSLLVQSMRDDSSGNPPASAPPSQEAAASTFSGEPLKNQVTDLLAEAKKNGGKDSDRQDDFGTSTEPPRATSDGPSILTTVDVPDCIREGIGRSESPLAAQEGSYQGVQAYLVLLPDASGSDYVTAYVVDASCVKKAPASPGEILVQYSYAHPSASESTGP
jgi:hypothetical protein